jgi:hypothetical protein
VVSVILTGLCCLGVLNPPIYRLNWRLEMGSEAVLIYLGDEGVFVLVSRKAYLRCPYSF